MADDTGKDEVSVSDFRTCPYCRHVHKNPDGTLECWRGPPVVIGQPVFGPPFVPGGPPRVHCWFTQVLRPAVRAEWTCGEFTRRDGVLAPSSN